MASYRVNRAYLPLKAAYFFYFAGLACVFPYLSVFFVSLGVKVWQVGILRGIDPVLSFLFSPLWGMCADKFSKHRLALKIAIIGSGVTYFSFIFVPYIARPYTETAARNWVTCTSPNMTSGFEDMQCSLDQDFERYTYGQVSTRNTTSSFEMDSGCLSVCSNVRPPQWDHVSRVCGKDGSDWTCATCDIDQSSNDTTNPRKQHLIVVDCLSPSGEYDGWLSAEEVNAEIGKDSDVGAFLQAIDCSVQLHCCSCELERDTKMATSPQIIFIILLILVLLSNFFDCNILYYIDATIMDLLGDNEDRFGEQRLWGAIAWGITAFTGGLAVDILSRASHSFELRYEPLFIIFASAMLMTFLVSSCIAFPEHHRPRNVTKNLLQLYFKPEVVMFILVTAVEGACLGMSFSFVMIYWQNDLEISITFLGVLILVTTIAETPMLYFSGWIIQRIGYQGVVYSTLLAYALRYTLYGIVRDPWSIVPVQLLHGITFGIGWPGFTIYANEIAPIGMSATLQSLKGSSYFGIGFTTGNFIGGAVYDKFGTLTLFYGTAVLCIATGVIFFCVDTLPKIICPRQKEDDSRDSNVIADELTKLPAQSVDDLDESSRDAEQDYAA